ncbi:MAG: hypothetical protein ACQER9_01090 [Nanobdellota archaeon]
MNRILNYGYKFLRRSLLLGSGIVLGASNHEFFDDFKFNLGKKINNTVEEKLMYSSEDRNYKALEKLVEMRRYKE